METGAEYFTHFFWNKVIMSASSNQVQKFDWCSADLGQEVIIDVCNKLEIAVTAYKNNDLVLAKELFLEVLSIDSFNFLANKFSSYISLKQGKWQEAVKYSLVNYKNNSDKIESFLDLAIILLKNQHHDINAIKSAIDVLNDALKLDDQAIEVYLKLYNAYESLGQLSDAKKYLDKAKNLNPDHLMLMFEESNYLRDIGEFEASMQLSRKILKKNPKHIDAIYNLFFLKKFTLYDDELRHAESLCGTESNLHQKRTLNFALFKAYDDLKNYKKAYFYLRKGNQFAVQMRTMDPNHDLKIMFYLRKIFTKEFIKKKRAELNLQTDKYQQPIFIVSMPRSGSTLVEKILSSHSKVSSAGEPLYFKQCCSSLRFDFSLEDPLVSTNSNLELLAKEYLSLLAQHSKDGGAYVIDKLPINFAFLGLIKIFYPEAKIIFVNRDPCAVGYSCYKHMFSQGQEFSFHFDDIVNYYKNYIIMKNHWAENLEAGSFIELRYEDLVESPRENIERLLNYCELEWEDSCENFYKTEAVIQSASLAQVRKPIYKNSNESWKNYENFMPEFFEKLKKINEMIS